MNSKIPTHLLLFVFLMLGCAESVPEKAIPKDPVYDDSKVTETEPTEMQDNR